MIKSIKHSLWLCLLTSFTAGLASAVRAADKPAPAAEKKTAPAGLPGKIVAVNKKANTLTVDIKGKIYVFKMSSHLKLEKEGREIQLGELLPGQAANFVTGLSTDGGLEIVAVTVEANTEASEAAARGGSRGPNPPPILSPQANRPPISPNQ
jgi:hypothetical protein